MGLLQVMPMNQMMAPMQGIVQPTPSNNFGTLGEL